MLTELEGIAVSCWRWKFVQYNTSLKEVGQVGEKKPERTVEK